MNDTTRHRRTVTEREALGREARRQAPRTPHEAWTPAPERALLFDVNDFEALAWRAAALKRR
jgi:hypothetical protein